MSTEAFLPGEMDGDDVFWTIVRSGLSDKVWVPCPTGWGEQEHLTNAGGLRAVARS